MQRTWSSGGVPKIAHSGFSLKILSFLEENLTSPNFRIFLQLRVRKLMATYVKIISITRPFIHESFICLATTYIEPAPFAFRLYAVSQYSALIHNLHKVYGVWEIIPISLHISETFNQYWVRKSN